MGNRFPLRRTRAPAGELHEIFGVALVHDGEVAREARFGSEVAQQAMTGGVERPALDARRRRTHQAFGATQHFVCGAAGEGEEEDALGRNAVVDEVGDAIDERSCLSRSRRRR